MSVTLNYFFNYDGDLPTLAKLIDGTLGCALTPYEGTQKTFSVDSCRWS